MQKYTYLALAFIAVTSLMPLMQNCGQGLNAAGEKQTLPSLSQDDVAIKEPAATEKRRFAIFDNFDGNPTSVPIPSATEPLERSWPDIIQCRARDGKYEIVYLTGYGLERKMTYSNSGVEIEFDINGLIRRVDGGTAALKESDCRIGQSVIRLNRWAIQKLEVIGACSETTRPYPHGYWREDCGAPSDILVCGGITENSDVAREYFWNVGGDGVNTRYFESYGGEFLLNFSDVNGSVQNVISDSVAVEKSKACKPGVLFNNRVNETDPVVTGRPFRRVPSDKEGVVIGVPDVIVCGPEGQYGPYELLYHRVKGQKGYTAFTNSKSLLRIQPNGDIITAQGTDRFLNSQCKVGKNIKDLPRYSFVKSQQRIYSQRFDFNDVRPQIDRCTEDTSNCRFLEIP